MSFLKRFQTILESLYQLPDRAQYVVAYSGGVDSHVLLHCCHQLNLPVRAVHVHHGLQTVADDWVDHCNKVCDALNVPLDVVYVQVLKKSGQSPEEAARNARYSALQANLRGHDCLLTAQHMNDQAETLLLQLFRSAGSAGLSAMPVRRQLGDYVLLRPLLGFYRQEIEGYASENALQWVEDPSNRDNSFDRNFIRNRLMPLLEERWPETAERLSNVAGLQSDNLVVLEDMAAIDLANAISTPEYKAVICAYEIVSVLSVTVLKQLSAARLYNLLRYWLLHAAVKSTDKISPTRKLLEEIQRTMLASQQDASPLIRCSRYEIRRYKHRLYLIRPVSGLLQADVPEIVWDPCQPLPIPVLNMQMTLTDNIKGGLHRQLLNGNLKLGFRRRGEYFHPVGRRHSRSLKKLLQEAGVPPWERDYIPLLYCNEELIAVIGLWLSEKHVVGEDESGWDIRINNL